MKSLEERILQVWIKPRASSNEILGFRDGYLWIRVAAAPLEGKANRLCCQILGEALGVSPSRVEILSGHHARRKRIRIKEINPAVFSIWENKQKKLG